LTYAGTSEQTAGPMKLVTVPYASAVLARYDLIHTEDSLSMRRVYPTHGATEYDYVVRE